MHKTEQPAEEQPKPAKNKRKRKWFLLISFVLLAVFLYFIWWVYFGGSPIIISYQTTRITEPIDEEGYVDYLAYINQQASEGVTPENNFEYTYRKLVGADDIVEEKIRDEYLKILGLNEEDILTKEKRFQPINHFLNSRLLPENPTYDEEQKVLNRIHSIQYPPENKWEEEDLELVQEWLNSNEYHLKELSKSANRPYSYTPYINVIDPGNNTSTLLKIDYNAFNNRYDLADSFLLRSMYRLSQKDITGAIDNLIVAHKLARHTINNCICSNEHYLGASFESGAFHRFYRIAESPHLNQNHIHSYLTQLNPLGEFSGYIKTVDELERFIFLEFAINLHRNQAAGKKRFGSSNSFSPRQDAIDYNSILRWGNKQYDLLIDAAKIPNSVKRYKQLGFIANNFENRVRELNSSWVNKISAMVKAGSMANYTADRIQDAMYATLCPHISDNINTEVKMRFYRNAAQIICGLKLHEMDHKTFPETLDDLTPEYLKEIPLDPFSGKQPVYRKTEKGFIIYSVGPNQKDDNGIGRLGINRDSSAGDDVGMEYPRKMH